MFNQQNIPDDTIITGNTRTGEEFGGKMIYRTPFPFAIFITQKVNILFTMKQEWWRERDKLHVTTDKVMNVLQ
ncbi:TPA: hypothetical protein MH536_26805 [Klebsiella pneumoniae]|nr:hypothetical protein [Klebsiella pneumoniae]